MTLEPKIPAIITEASNVAAGVRLLRIAARGGSALPGYEPGAHIDVFLPDGAARQYSLIDPPLPDGTYRIAVALEEQGRGGSRYLHEKVAAGDALEIGTPRCHFPVDTTAPFSVLFAGGIGVTPILCMAQALEKAGAQWAIHFGARTRAHATLLEEIERLAGDRLSTYFNLEGDAPMDFAQLVANAPADAHFYCCGPAPMIEAFRTACAAVSQKRVHFEQFTAAEPAALDGGYEVQLAKSGRTVQVEAGESILDALARAGMRMTYSCREGVCGSCETAVLSGRPDHRDAILTDAERAEGRTMMICCSGSLDRTLVLDL